MDLDKWHSSYIVAYLLFLHTYEGGWTIMSADIIMQYIVFLVVLVVLSIPLGTYMAKVMYG